MIYKYLLLPLTACAALFLGGPNVSAVEPLGVSAPQDPVIYSLDIQDSELALIKALAKKKFGDIPSLNKKFDNKKTNDPSIYYIIGVLFDEEGSYERARHYYKKGMQYDVKAAAGYFELLAEGKGGKPDFPSALKGFRAMADMPYEDAIVPYSFFLKGLALDDLVNTDIVQLYWLEYYANKGIDVFPNKTYLDNYSQVAEAYFTYAQSAQKDHKVMLLEQAKAYDMKSKKLQITQKINKELENLKPIKPSQSLSQACDLMFNAKKSARPSYAKAQLDIFANPEMAPDIIKRYRLALNNILYDSHEASNPVSFHFPGISLENILALLIDFDGTLPEFDVRNSSFDDALSDTYTAVYALNVSGRQLIELIVNAYGINVDCDGGSIHFSLTSNDPKTLAMKYIMPNFITSWEGDFAIDGGRITGKGVIDMEGVIQLEGQISNNKLNGEGVLYLNNRSVQYTNTHFTDNIMNGYGQMKMEGIAHVAGQYTNNQLHGQAEFNTYKFIYNGNMKNGKKDGLGTIKYVERHLPASEYISSSYPLKAKTSTKSWYQGPFSGGNRHGVGRCGLTKYATPKKGISCEFYKNQLIAIDGVSLLPSTPSTNHHLKVVDGTVYK